MDDALMDRALRYLQEGCEPRQAIIRARETLAIERVDAEVDKAKADTRKIEGRALYPLDYDARRMLMHRDGYWKRQAKPRSMMLRPDGDYGCSRLMVSDIPEDMPPLPTGTVRYFGSRMPEPKRQSRKRRVSVKAAKRPDAPIVVKADQSYVDRMTRMAKFGNAADYD